MVLQSHLLTKKKIKAITLTHVIKLNYVLFKIQNKHILINQSFESHHFKIRILRVETKREKTKGWGYTTTYARKY